MLKQRIALREIAKQMEVLELRSGFRITGATLNDGKRYLDLKRELFNLIN